MISLLAAPLATPWSAIVVHQTMTAGDELPAAGASAIAGLPSWGEVGPEVGGSVAPRGLAAGWAGLRWAPGWAAGLSVAGGGGIAAHEGPVPVGTADVAFDVSLGDRLAMRLDARSILGGDLTALQAGAGLVWRFVPRPEPVAEVVVAPAPVTEVVAEPEPFSVEPPDALIWLPHPICDWVTVAEAEASAERLDGQLARVWAPGYLPADSDLRGHLALEAAPPQGGIVVAAGAGDVITVDGADLPVADDGVALVNVAEGAHGVTIVGAGRDEAHEVAVASGYVTWVRVRDAEPVVVGFAVGSARVPPEALGELRALAAAPGRWTYEVAGSYSAEGRADDNVALAERRALAVRDALLAAGLPPEQVRVGVPFHPDPGAPPADQRVARVTARAR